MAKLTEKEMEQILQNEIPLESLVVDSGILEFHEEDGMSIGVSYEHIGLGTHCVGYIFNLFVKGGIYKYFWYVCKYLWCSKDSYRRMEQMAIKTQICGRNGGKLWKQ